MAENTILSGAILFLGVTSLYTLLALFQGLLPTKHANEIRKLGKVQGKVEEDNRSFYSHIVHAAHLSGAIPSRGDRITSRTELVKMLQYAAWSISPTTFRIISLVLAVVGFLALSPHVDLFMLPITLLVGPCTLHLILRRCMAQRSKRFSDDYPQLLMTMVALLKTGMTPMGALEEAARGLEASSLVRREVKSMLERIKVGLPEEKSIGIFGETIDHPEIELFVQSLLLGLRIGGSLTDSLERLSTQARKRHYFKSSAVASVAQQRGSIAAILIIMCGLATFLTIFMPRLAWGLYTDPYGWMVLQAAVVAIITAIAWLNRITGIKI